MTIRGADAQWIVPDWPAPANVRALITTRAGGVSTGPFGAADGGGLNLGLKSGDSLEAVQANRVRLRAALPAEPRWLQQVHGAAVVDVGDGGEAAPAADAAIALQSGCVCVVSIADCMPVLFADRQGRAVGVAHAGWRGLAAGILQNTAAAMRRRLGDEEAALLAFLGPAIGPKHFEVGAEVLVAMSERLPRAAEAFRPLGGGKYLCDLFALARQALAQAAITQVFGGTDCTYSDATRFYSYRRDKVTGRHAALIWIEG